MTKAAIIRLRDRKLKATSSADFIPEDQTITDVVEAFAGNTEGLAERFINVGCGVNTSVPGKMDAGKAIYGNDGTQGGKMDCLFHVD